MSIIDSNPGKTAAKANKASKNFDIFQRSKPIFLRIVYVFCILLVVSVIGFFIMGKLRTFLLTSHNWPSKELTSSSKIEAPDVLPSLSLTGIFFMFGEYTALINNQLVQAGDFIEGVQIMKIDPNGLEIMFNQSSFRIEYPF